MSYSSVGQQQDIWVNSFLLSEEETLNNAMGILCTIEMFWVYPPTNQKLHISCPVRFVFA